jgi:hypothetical protein
MKTSGENPITESDPRNHKEVVKLVVDGASQAF